MPGSLPFTIEKTENFYEKLGDWIGDVFYDILPEAGFELRDEQIYMAFQLEKAFKEKKSIFAEAGVGTGKTIVYLLYAVCYARYTRQPAIIACADETLIEQLVKKEGDIKKLEKALNLNIDVRLAKSRDQYLCLNKLDAQVSRDSEVFDDVYDSLPRFALGEGQVLQKFEKYGDRKDYPELPDEHWAKIGWDPLQDCLACSRYHRCGMTLQREHYRNAADIIVCSHDFYMEHIWTRESRKREGQLPFLPESSCVVFDEGHLLEFASQKALTYRFAERTLETLLERIMGNDIRERTLLLMEEALSLNEHFFTELAANSTDSQSSDKMAVHKTEGIMKKADRLLALIDEIQEELVFESEMFILNEYSLKIVEEYLDQISFSLSLFVRRREGINWLESRYGEKTLVIMPKMVSEILRKEVFSEKKPYVFSSATLSDRKSFEYVASSLGIDDYLSFSVDSPFDYGSRMSISIPEFPQGDFAGKADFTLERLIDTGGHALILFSNKAELHSFKEFIGEDTPFPVLFEGDAEISTLVSRFQNEANSVLCSVNLWEGLDVPGSSLQNVIIFSLPFPPNDPVFSARREEAADPYNDVDLPYMLLRLRQGLGRLIRTHEDSGRVDILLEQGISEETRSSILEVLPVPPAAV
ncbi:ATP-dependent DNA helicase [Mesobacillus zeae]|uniref:ATP-dependent DNA helicase n=1 Tax=Mesobacillus zeae TaxID=1917180 RepID=A0A398B3P4_9BACI|nr:ATP-dependent DNA helicase [Mesobacillus zeae]RID84201.1 ATP-dependent DNA helicase [Mesobacillus zeae]